MAVVPSLWRGNPSIPQTTRPPEISQTLAPSQDLIFHHQTLMFLTRLPMTPATSYSYCPNWEILGSTCLPPIPPNHHQFLDEPYFVMQDASSILQGMFIKRRKPGNCIVSEKKNQLRYFIATDVKYGCLLCMGLLRSPLFCPTDLS